MDAAQFNDLIGLDLASCESPGDFTGLARMMETLGERSQAFRNTAIAHAWVAGHSVRQISRAVGLSGGRVHQIVVSQLGAALSEQTRAAKQRELFLSSNTV